MKLQGGAPYNGPFTHMTSAIGNYVRNGVVFISVPYRATDVRYWYDEGGARHAEELIRVDDDGRLALDRSRTMGDYKTRACWQELITKCMYDAVQALEHILAHAVEYGIDVHRMFFISSSAGTSVVNYLTYVYHQWHRQRFTPRGMILGSPQYDVPVYCALDNTWKIFMDFASPELPASKIFDYTWCGHFVGNEFCGGDPHGLAARQTGIKFEESCNKTWNEEAMKFCRADTFPGVTVANLHASLKWNRDDPEVGRGMEKLWYSSKNMASYHPVPFYVMLHSHDNFFIHNSVYVRAFAHHANHVGINFTAYFAHYPGIGTDQTGYPLWTKLDKMDNKQLYYRSSIAWRGLYPKVHDTAPGSVDEHLLYVCFVLQLPHCGPEAPASRYV